MCEKRWLALGRSLFTLSILFIVAGLYLDFEEKLAFSDPIKDIIVVAGNDDKVIISTIDDDKDEVLDNTPETDSNENSSIGSEMVPGDTPSIMEPTPVPEEPQTTPETVIPQPPKAETNPIPTIEDVNNVLRREIENTYGIEVKYGSETDGYSAGTLDVISISNSTIIQSGLNELKAALALYPQNFFKEFGDISLNLKIYLVQGYTVENVTGITELSGDNVTISIAMDYSFAESFHHEVYHYIEHFIERKNGEFSTWNTYNPANFRYGGTANPNLSFNRTGSVYAPFVNNYAQTNADEDRASTFEYMTADSKAICFDSSDYPIWKKSSYIALMIDTYFETVSPSVIEYWERFIY